MDEKIYEALNIIQQMCAVNECPTCPFNAEAVGCESECMFMKQFPYEWKFKGRDKNYRYFK